MAKIDRDLAAQRTGSRYPPPYDDPCKTRTASLLGEAAGLTQFGAIEVRLPPGAWSSQRHWHTHEDEFVYVLAGQPTFVDDAGAQPAAPGDAFGFKAGDQNGHHFRNETQEDVVLLVVGSRNDADQGAYSDIDMTFGPNRYRGAGRYCRKDGSPL